MFIRITRPNLQGSKRKKNGKSHENALTEKGPRKRIMEKASTPLTEKAKNPWHGQESQRLGTPRKKTFTRVKNHRGSVLRERKPLQGPRISKARVSRKRKLSRGDILDKVKGPGFSLLRISRYSSLREVESQTFLLK